MKQYEDQIKQHAMEEYPMECCGVITPDGYIKLENIAPEPTEDFEIDTDEIKDLQVLAVVHSHPDGYACPTASDMRSQISMDVPWCIVTVTKDGPQELFWFGDGVEYPLVGRGFRHGVTDCYDLIRDWYRIERGVTLPQYPRDWEWWHKDQDLYRQFFENAGFIEVDEPQEGDVFLAQIRSKVPNHGGVYLGNGLALHHLSARLPCDPSRLSVREPVGRWQPYIRKWLRYAPKS